jgi:hypothetical protein
MDQISLGGILTRIAVSLLLVMATFNPTGFSYFHWVRDVFPSVSPPQVVVGLLLLIIWIFLWRSMMQAVGKLGLVLMAALFAAVVWMFVTWGWIDPGNDGAMTWVALVILGLILGIGMSWAIIRRDLTGQASVDEIDGHR